MPNICAILSQWGPTGWGNFSRNLHGSLERKGAIRKYENYDSTLVAIADTSFKPIQGLDKAPGKIVGIGFCEFDSQIRNLKSEAIEQYDHIICGSSWMQKALDGVIAERGLKTKTSAHIQGVDHAVFENLGKKTTHTGAHFFKVGSFGKFEFRKGQDIVIAAMAEFMRRRSDVFFNCLWNNPWPQTMTFPQGCGLLKSDTRALMENESQAAYYCKVMEHHGIPIDRVVTMDAIADPKCMAYIYKSCDVGLFPNRLEAGSNLCLQEMISCGIPCIATYAHGHMDLEGSFYELSRVDKKQDSYGNTYYEPCFDDILIALEKAYQGRLGLDMAQAQRVSDTWTWDALANHVIEVMNA